MMIGAAIVDFLGLGDDMKRREFIGFIGAASAVPAFSVARSQEAGRSRRIGILADAAILADPRGERGPPQRKAYRYPCRSRPKVVVRRARSSRPRSRY